MTNDMNALVPATDDLSAVTNFDYTLDLFVPAVEDEPTLLIEEPSLSQLIAAVSAETAQPDLSAVAEMQDQAHLPVGLLPTGKDSLAENVASDTADVEVIPDSNQMLTIPDLASRFGFDPENKDEILTVRGMVEFLVAADVIEKSKKVFKRNPGTKGRPNNLYVIPADVADRVRDFFGAALAAAE
jgi:hypothetical protein